MCPFTGDISDSILDKLSNSNATEKAIPVNLTAKDMGAVLWGNMSWHLRDLMIFISLILVFLVCILPALFSLLHLQLPLDKKTDKTA